jgi:preprotein translocase subunit SecA
MRRFISALVERFLTAAGLPEDAPIESKMVSNAIRSAQTQVEAQNFEMRKNILKFDDVMNRQRTVIYGERRTVLEGADIKEQVAGFVSETLSAYVDAETANGYSEDWDLEKLFTEVRKIYPISFSIDELIAQVGSRAGLDAEFLKDRIIEDFEAAYANREAEYGDPAMREAERKVLLYVIDEKWREHLFEMDYLQEGIYQRALAQRDPLVEYQKEGFDLFAAMMDAIKEEIAGLLFKIEIIVESSDKKVIVPGLEVKKVPTTGLNYTSPGESGPRTTGEVPRNAPCPCGSGKKNKRCHGGASKLKEELELYTTNVSLTLQI